MYHVPTNESLNLTRGVVYCKDLRYSDETLTEKLKNQGVARSRRLRKRLTDSPNPPPFLNHIFQRSGTTPFAEGGVSPPLRPTSRFWACRLELQKEIRGMIAVDQHTVIIARPNRQSAPTVTVRTPFL